MEQADTIIQIPHFYGSLKGMQNKFDKYARQDAFTGSTRAVSYTHLTLPTNSRV